MASAYLRRDPLNVAWPGYPGALRERARMGAGPDHRVLVDVRLRPSGGRERTGAAGHLAVYCEASPGCRSVWYPAAA